MSASRPAALFLLTIAFVLPLTARAEEPKSERKYLLERVDDTAVVQLYADGFKDLSLKEKTLIYHLYNAAIAGRDIYYNQRFSHGLLMRGWIEHILKNPQEVDPATLAEIQRYAKLFWISSGPYNHLTTRKFTLKCTPEDFEKAMRSADRNFAASSSLSGVNRPEILDEIVKFTKPFFFDAESQPIVTNKSPGPGKDILADSANNLYEHVSTKDLVGFEEKFGLNSRLVKRNGKLVEEVYRVDGLYGSDIARIIHHLAEAKRYAPEPTAKALEALIQWYITGEDEDRKAYDIAWVKDKDAQIDTINGFVEVYLDPRGVKGAWEAAVYYVNKEKTGAIKKLAGQAQWFEDHMPWDKAYRKANVKGITANAVDIVIETGESGPITPIGINLPNDESVRESYGSKSVSLANVIEANDKATPTALRAEFSWTKEEAERATKWSTLAGELLVNMHEVIGHASGRVSDQLKGKPQDALKQYFSALEEGRADLVALYYMPDAKLAELSLVAAKDQEEFARAAYENYTRNGMVQLRRVPRGSQIEEDHMRNRQMIVRWMIDKTKAVEVRKRDGKTYYVMTDAKAFREGIGKLLAEVQRIKSEGDFAAGKALFEDHGIHFDPALRDEVVARVKQVNPPSSTAFVMPRLEAVKNASGAITDVTISYPMDLTKQMLEYSAVGRK